jgi:hypothetical protein
MTIKYTKLPYRIPNGREIDQVAIKYTHIFQCKALQNLPKLGVFGLKICTPSGNPEKKTCPTGEGSAFYFLTAQLSFVGENVTKL